MIRKPEYYFKEFFKGTKTMFKEFFNKETNKKQRANMWTFLRLINPIFTAIIIAIAGLTGLTALYILGTLNVGFGAITDFFDGRSARKHNSHSLYGKRLDQVADKFYCGLTAIILLFLNPLYILTIIGEGAIAAVNLTYAKKYKDIEFSSSKLGKIKEWPLFIALGFGFLGPISNITTLITNILVLLASSFQVATTIDYAINNNNLIKKSKKPIKIELEEKNTIVEETKTDKKTQSLKDKYIDLRNVLNMVLEEKKQEELLENSYQKKKVK